MWLCFRFYPDIVLVVESRPKDSRTLMESLCLFVITVRQRQGRHLSYSQNTCWVRVSPAQGFRTAFPSMLAAVYRYIGKHFTCSSGANSSMEKSVISPHILQNEPISEFLINLGLASGRVGDVGATCGMNSSENTEPGSGSLKAHPPAPRPWSTAPPF